MPAAGKTAQEKMQTGCSPPHLHDAHCVPFLLAVTTGLDRTPGFSICDWKI